MYKRVYIYKKYVFKKKKTGPSIKRTSVGVYTFDIMWLVSWKVSAGQSRMRVDQTKRSPCKRPRRPCVYLVRPLRRARPFAYLACRARLLCVFGNFSVPSVCTHRQRRARSFLAVSVAAAVRLAFDSVYSIRRPWDSSGGRSRGRAP